MTTTTDLLRRAAELLRSLARHPEASREDAAELRADAASLLALADQMERAEPVAWTTGIEWGYCESETVQKLTRHEQRRYGFTQPLYTHPAPEVTRDAENVKLREALQRLLTAAIPFYTTINRNSDLSAAIFNASSILTWASYAAMQEPKS